MNNTPQSLIKIPRFLRSRNISISHGMFNRHSGTSPSPFSSLNTSFGVGDKPRYVTANREIVKKSIGANHLVSATQVHGDKIYCAGNIQTDTEMEGNDALVTEQPGIGLLIQQADCQAILLHDPVRDAIGAVHCGWRGSVSNIIGKTITLMHRRFGTDPSTLLAAVSPSLGPCCAEFINFREELPRHFHDFQAHKNHFNFWDISVYQLAAAGVRPQHISVAATCTCCNRDYFSYRRSKSEGLSITGRNCSVICLPGG